MTWTNFLDLKGCPSTKKILNTIPLTKRKHTKTSLFKRHPKRKLHITHNYCLRGRISHSCPPRKPNAKMLQAWIPKETIPENMVSTNIRPKFNVKARKV